MIRLNFIELADRLLINSDDWPAIVIS